jgi:hypothetical protein
MGQPEGYAGNCIGMSMFRKQYTDIADRTINQACIMGLAARRRLRRSRAQSRP